jgi:predicted permease
MLQDIRYAIRMLRKSPGASAIAVMSLALGIAINTTVFGWIRGILLDPLPGVTDSSRLVTIETVASSGTMIDSSFPDYQTFRDVARQFSGVIAFKERPVGFGSGRSTERAWAMMVTGNYFDVLGVRPALGRFFEANEQDDAPNAHPVAVLGHAIWQARFNADPAVVGRTVLLNKQPYTVIGVAPEAFFGTISGLRFDVFVPLTMQPSLTGSSGLLTNRGNRPLYLLARLRPGATIDQAQAEVTRIAATTAAERPDSNLGITAKLLPVASARRGAQHDLGPLLRILFAVGGLVLLIVCANVANLQLAQAASRQREIGIRLGLGASRLAIVRQLVTEGLVLGAVSGAIGVLLSAWLMDSVRLLLPFVEYPIVVPTTIRGQDVAFAVGASIAASFLFSLVPGIRASGTEIVAAMNIGRQTEDVSTSRIAAALVVAQVALTLVALVSAGLLVRSFVNARRVNPGFNAGNVLLVGVNLSTAGYVRVEGLSYLDRLVTEIRELPGVQRVALAEDVPLGLNGGSWEDLAIDGYVPRTNESMKIYRNLIGPGYFELMGIRLVEGRDFTDLDLRDARRVAIVNQTFARRYFGAASVLGQQFTGWGEAVTIVGVVADSKYHELSESAQPYFFVPLRQFFNASTSVALHVRVAGDPMTVVPTVRSVMRAIDSAVPTDLMTTMASYTSVAYSTQEIAASLLSLLGALALTLSAVGLYGLVAHNVARRRREIGVRMALGATASDILRLVVGHGLALVAVGAAAGGVLTVLGVRVLSSLLVGVSPLDAGAFGVGAGLLVAVTCLASYVPARAAARVDPVRALRAE